MAKTEKGTPTSLNLWVLGQVFPAGAETVANALSSTQVPHMRRCMKAGLVAVEGSTLRLTEEGRRALGRTA